MERLEDIRRIYTALPEPTKIAYAIGAMAGLRTGEVLALRWAHVDMSGRRIHVHESVDGPLKDDDSRMVPIQDALHPVLAAWKLRTGGLGRVIPPMRSDGDYLDPHTVRRHLAKALKVLKVAKMTWYQATRHTFASHWVMQGGAIEKLREVLGHSSVTVTERYSHLKAELFSDKDRGLMAVDLTPGKVVSKARSGGAA